jgi:serine/threonine-protein kinase
MDALTHIGKYRIEGELGRGAMGVVFKAFDPIVERSLAIKTIPLNVEAPNLLVQRLQREAKTVGQLEHPNIVTLYDAGEAGGLFYMAMQFIQGETLRDRMNRQRWFSLKEIKVIFRQICAALDYAHRRGVVHRNIKPSNIMITSDEVVKLTDFGIAKLTGSEMTTPGVIMGTPSYMSPEQAVGKPLDGRSDICSLGSILYELITGEPAFPGLNSTTVIYRIVHESPSPIASLQPGFGPNVEAIVLKVLAKPPEHRYQSCAELAAALDYCDQEAVTGSPFPVGARVPSGTHPSESESPGLSTPVAASPSIQLKTEVPASRRGNGVWLAGGLLTAALVAAGAWGVMRLRHTAPIPPPTSITSVTKSPETPASASSLPQTAAPKMGMVPVSRASMANPEASTGALPVALSTSPQRRPTPGASTLTTVTQSAHPSSEQKVLPTSGQGVTSITPQPAVVPLTGQTQPETFQEYMLSGDLAFQQSH